MDIHLLNDNFLLGKIFLSLFSSTLICQLYPRPQYFLKGPHLFFVCHCITPGRIWVPKNHFSHVQLCYIYRHMYVYAFRFSIALFQSSSLIPVSSCSFIKVTKLKTEEGSGRPMLDFPEGRPTGHPASLCSALFMMQGHTVRGYSSP